jgi:hypothetical protein
LYCLIKTTKKMRKNLVIEGLQVATLATLQIASVCLGSMAIGGIIYAFYRIITDNLF